MKSLKINYLMHDCVIHCRHIVVEIYLTPLEALSVCDKWIRSSFNCGPNLTELKIDSLILNAKIYFFTIQFKWTSVDFEKICQNLFFNDNADFMLAMLNERT